MKKWLHEGHDHGGGGDKIATLLSYMYEHNHHHAAELDSLIEELHRAGQKESASLVEEAKGKFEEGSALLHEAVHRYTEE